MEELTPEEIVNNASQIEALMLSSEWKIVNDFFDTKIEELKDIRNIESDFEVQCRANAKAIEIIENLRSEMQNLVYEGRETKKLLENK
jgi:hypothetical protein